MAHKIYDYSEVKREISGFGGSYEENCRNMVIAGLEWCDKHPNANLSYKEFKNIYGLTTEESEDMKLCQDAMLEASNNDCTGAMMQASMGHLMFIRKNGWQKYVSEMNERANADAELIFDMALTPKEFLEIAGLDEKEKYSYSVMLFAMEFYHKAKLKELGIIEVEGKPICKNDTSKHIQPDKEKAEQP